MTSSSALVVLARRRRRKPPNSARTLLIALVIGLTSVAGVAAVASLGALGAIYNWYGDGYVPIEAQLRERSTGLTAVYDRSGPAEGTFLGYLSNPRGTENRPVPLSEISPAMIMATISTEDHEFWGHQGVNIRGTLRAILGSVSSNTLGEDGGGSSITQQLVKNVYLATDCYVEEEHRVCIAPRTVDRKLREMVYALKVEDSLTKEEILELYLNRISYADRYVGVEAAAYGYFRKSAAELTMAEAALLAGIPAAPGRYHPRLSCEVDPSGACIRDESGRTTLAGEAKVRQEQVLDLMVEHGDLTPAEAQAAKAEQILVWPEEQTERASAWIDNQVEPRLERMCEAGLLPIVAGAANCLDSVRNAGYRVTTSLDAPLTTAARELAFAEVQSGLNAGCDCHNASVVTVDPPSGEIRVYVENVNPASTEPEVAGHIDQATEINQPGSSLKPVIYIAWMEYLGRGPMSTFWDTNPMELVEEDEDDRPPAADDEEPVRITNSRPRGVGNTEGLITLRSSLGGSQNVPAFRAADEVGVDKVIEMAKRLGITTLEQGFDPTFWNHSNVYYGPAIATGGANIRVVDMAYVDATIANMGVMVGTESLASELDMDALRSASEDAEAAEEQKRAFQRGNLRLPGTRPLDPIVVLKVQDASGEVLFEQGEPSRVEAVNPGTAWLLHSVMSDCEARWLIWSCGSSNQDSTLDFFLDGEKIPSGVKTGTQQGFADANDTLETWVTAYTRNAGTAVWVGNADNSLVRDGPEVGFAAARTALRVMKNWMAVYHGTLRDRGLISGIETFEELQPANVAFGPFLSATTEGGRRGGCGQDVDGWYRTDVDYGAGDCETIEIDVRNGRRATEETPSRSRRQVEALRVPALRQDLVVQLARRYGLRVYADADTRIVPWSPPSASSPAPPPPTPEAAATQEAVPTQPPPPTVTPEPADETPTPRAVNTPTPAPTEDAGRGRDASRTARRRGKPARAGPG